jgi:cobalt-zinc-cadmium efflux system outer membrane protein
MLPIPRNRSVCCACLFLIAWIGTARPAWAQPTTLPKAQPGHVLTLEQSVAWALQNNPDLAVARQQRGIAQAGVVIARTYPHNPVWGSAVLGDNGPAAAGITNHVFQQHTITQEVELRKQGKIRREIAAAAFSRVEWEIALQEQKMAVHTIRAFNGYLYQQEKLRVLDDTIRLQEDTSKKVKQLVDQNLRLKAADFMLARSDELEARAQRGSRQTQAVMAWHELRRVMGVQKEIVEVSGRLPSTTPAGSADQWTQFAYQVRPDLQAVQMAYLEAEQRERLEIANRFGNPQIGVKSEFNETNVVFVGPTVQFALPVFNRKRGEILLRQAEKMGVLLDKQRVETQINQDVLAALDRLAEAKKWVSTLEEILPALQKTTQTFDNLFKEGEIDVMRLIEVRRRHLRSRDSYLDALWELNQARADLAAAVGDFTLATEEHIANGKLGPPE